MSGVQPVPAPWDSSSEEHQVAKRARRNPGWTSGAGGWEHTIVNPQYQRHRFGIGDDGQYFSELDDDDAYARHPCLRSTRMLQLPTHEGTSAPSGDDSSADVSSGAAFEETHLARGRNWEYELFDCDRDAAAVAVLHKDAQKDAVVLCVPRHHVFQNLGPDEPLVAVGPGVAEALLPGTSLSATSHLCFVSIQRVAFRDGLYFLSWCTNPGCADIRQDNQALLDEVFCSHVDGFPRTDVLQEFPDQNLHVCRCAKSAMNLFTSGDPGEFDKFFDEIEPHEPMPVIVRAYGQSYCLAYAPGSSASSRAALHQWGILRQSVNEAFWTCDTCPSNKRRCPHQARGTEVLHTKDYTFYDHERKFYKWFDVATDRRRLTCHSRQAIPERLAQHPGYQKYFVKKSEPFPAELVPEGVQSGTTGFCSSCEAQTTWAPRAPEAAVILGCETIDKPTLRTYTCTNCARTIDVDGYGYAVLRKGLWKSPAFEASVLPGPGPVHLCFTWLFMRSCTNELRKNKDWRHILTKQIELYQDIYGFSKADLALLVHRLYKPFQEATLDELELRGIDLLSSRICKCEDPYADVIIDGTAVSTQTQAMQVLGPYYPAVDDTELRWGSAYQSRIVLDKKALRDGLRAFARSTAAKPIAARVFNALHAGLLVAGHEAIAAFVYTARLSVGCAEAAALDDSDNDDSAKARARAEARAQQELNERALFGALAAGANDVEDGPAEEPGYCDAWAASLCRDLATDTPACVMLPQAFYHLADAYSATGNWSAASAGTVTNCRGADEARLHLPVLFRATKEAARLSDADRSRTACGALRQICGILKQVAEQAFVSQAPARRPPKWTPAAKASSTRRHAAPLNLQRRPSQWGEHEAYYLMGETCGQQPYTANECGGALARLPLFAQDGKNSKGSGEATCTKKQTPRRKLAPGVLLLSCVSCKRTVDWVLMPDAESPQTVFQFLYTKVPRDRTLRLSYDNGCNLVHYILNRDPELMRHTQVSIDALHYVKGHTCAAIYNTARYKGEGQGALFDDSSLAERANIALGNLRTAAAHMSQFTFLTRLALSFDTQNRDCRSRTELEA